MAVGLTLVAFGVPTSLAFGIGAALAQAVIEGVSGNFTKENWDDAVIRIFFAGVFAALTSFIIGLKFDFLSAKTGLLGNLVVNLKVGPFLTQMGAELSKSTLKSVFFGGMTRMMDIITELMRTGIKTGETLPRDEQERIIREINKG